jgi:hypothetical protein
MDYRTTPSCPAHCAIARTIGDRPSVTVSSAIGWAGRWQAVLRDRRPAIDQPLPGMSRPTCRPAAGALRPAGASIITASPPAPVSGTRWRLSGWAASISSCTRCAACGFSSAAMAVRCGTVEARRSTTRLGLDRIEQHRASLRSAATDHFSHSLSWVGRQIDGHGGLRLVGRGGVASVVGCAIGSLLRSLVLRPAIQII